MANKYLSDATSDAGTSAGESLPSKDPAYLPSKREVKKRRFSHEEEDDDLDHDDSYPNIQIDGMFCVHWFCDQSFLLSIHTQYSVNCHICA